MRRAPLLCAVLAACAWAGSAGATPTRWAKARDPQLYRDEKLAAESERELLRMTARRRRPAIDDVITPPTAHAMKARLALAEAGAQKSKSSKLRHLFARVEQELHNFEEAALLYESVVGDATLPTPLRGDAWGDLAIVYARLKRVDKEIEAEEMAIALEPQTASRALTLANQAEAYMGKGDISRAIAGYRSALEGLTTFELLRVAPTTLYSLGVALDRSGDLEGGFDEIVRARSYDPRDQFLRGESWFFSTAWDEDWYEALGHWVVGRRHDDQEVRLGAYERAVVAWKQYLARAPAADPYALLARSRLKACEKEFQELSKRAQTPTPLSPVKPRRRDVTKEDVPP